jgi:hypothetical protein
MDFQTIKMVLALSVPFLIMTLWAIIHAAQKEFGSFREKVFWMLIAAIPFVGFVFYLIFGFRKGKKGAGGGEIHG